MSNMIKTSLINSYVHEGNDDVYIFYLAKREGKNFFVDESCQIVSYDMLETKKYGPVVPTMHIKLNSNLENIIILGKRMRSNNVSEISLSLIERFVESTTSSAFDTHQCAFENSRYENIPKA